MSLRIFLSLLSELSADSEFEWEVMDARRKILRRGASTAKGIPPGEPCELVIAAPDVLLLNMVLPNLPRAKLHEALPGLVEDAMVNDIEQAFVVASPRDAEGRATVAVVEQVLLRRAIDMLSRTGLRVRSATPEPLSLHGSTQVWRLRIRERYCCVRTGSHSGFASSPTDGASPPPELQLALAQCTSPPVCIQVEGEFDLAAWQEALGSIPVQRAGEDEYFAPPLELDLLQFEFAPGLGDWKAWRPAIAAGIAFLCVSMIGLNFHTWQLSKEAGSLRQQMEASLKQTFPDVQAVLDPLLQMRRGVEILRSTGGIASETDFFPMAESFATLMAKPDSVQSLEYSNGTLLVQLAPGYEQDKAWRDTLAERATQSGLGLEYANARLTVRRTSRR